MSHLIPDGVENPGVLINNYETVKALQQAIINAPRDINIMRKNFMRAIEDDAWMFRLDPHTGEMFRYDNFKKFISDKMPGGLEANVEMIRSFLGDGAERERFDKLLQMETVKVTPVPQNTGRPEKVRKNSICVPLSKGGNDRRIARLKRDHADIADRLANGEFKSIAAAERAARGEEPHPAYPKKTALMWLDHWWDKADEETRQEFRRKHGI